MEMLFLLAAACPQAGAGGYMDHQCSLLLLICIERDPLAVLRLRDKALAHSMGPARLWGSLPGCVKLSCIFHICHHDYQGNVRFGPSHRQTVVRTPGLWKCGSSCPSYPQIAFTCGFVPVPEFKSVQRMTVRPECDQGWEVSLCSPVLWWR